MNLDDAKKQIQAYIKSNKALPLIVDVQTKQGLSDIIDYFRVGNNDFLNLESLCNPDDVLKLDELFNTVSRNTGTLFITRLTGYLKLIGEDETRKTLNTLVKKSITGHVVVLTYQCRNYLKFSDPRVLEHRTVLIIDEAPDKVANICLISPELAGAFSGAYNGIEKVGIAVEKSNRDTVYIATNAHSSDFPKSAYPISQLSSGYDILLDKDSRTSIVPESFGTPEQWSLALQKMGNKGNWSSVIEAEFGSELHLSHSLEGYYRFDANKKWLYFIALSICGVRDNEYLRMAVNSVSKSEELIRSIMRSILTVDKASKDFTSLYRQRKEIIRGLSDHLSEFISYCKVISIKGEDAIYYLTDSSQPEKERIISWLSVYGKNYTAAKLREILKTVYPDFAKYLAKYRFKNVLLDSYFENYKYQKTTNQILPSFEAIVDEQTAKLDFVTALKPRASVVDKLDAVNSRAYFFDALGVEYLGFIQEKSNEYGLATNIVCARCELPSITPYNKEFVKALTDKGCPVYDIKELDEIKHHGEDNFDYEKEKTPIYLIRELEIIDELLKKIRAGILSEQFDKAIILSDHGASRLAVLHETENKWVMATQGEHSGRCCKISEIDSKPDYAIEENGYWVLVNYDRFQGSRKANVEVHGGASLEEVTVPIIEITQKQSNIEAFIIDTSKVINLGAKEHAIIKIFVAIKSNNISIKMDDCFYDAEATDEPFVYAIDLPGYSKKGTYSFDIYNGSSVLSIGQRFEIKKKGMSTVDLFN